MFEQISLNNNGADFQKFLVYQHLVFVAFMDYRCFLSVKAFQRRLGIFAFLHVVHKECGKKSYHLRLF